jgi:hypothetical protein
MEMAINSTGNEPAPYPMADHSVGTAVPATATRYTGRPLREMLVAIDILSFFGPVIVAALLASVVIARTKGRPGPSWIIAAVSGTVTYEVLNFSLPFRSPWLEIVVVAFATGVLTLAMVVMLANQKPNGSALAVVVTWVILALVSIASTGRVAHAQKMAWSCDGVIALKYRSHNHAARTLVVSRPAAPDVTFEGVDEPLWNVVQLGRSYLRKPAWSAFGTLDGKRVRIVPDRLALFHMGPGR